MAIAFSKIKPGMTLYDRRRTIMGNTPVRELSEWPVQIVEVLPPAAPMRWCRAVVRWNGNPPETWGEFRLRKLFDWSMDDPTEAETTRGMLGQVVKVRRLPKAERIARKAARDAAKAAP